jgi:uncharacterized membrane protein YqiK
VGFLKTAWGWLKSNTWAALLAAVGILGALLGISEWRRKGEVRRRKDAEARAETAEAVADSVERVAELGREREKGDDAAEEVGRTEIEAIEEQGRADAAAHDEEIEAIDRAEEGKGDLADLANQRFGNPGE